MEDFSPRSLFPDNRGTKGVTVKIIAYKRKSNLLMEEG